MRILLINPAYHSEKLSTTMDEVHHAMEKKPPLGLLSLGSFLREKTLHVVRILDNQLASLTDEQLAKVLLDFQPEIVGITVVSFKVWEAYHLTTLVKGLFPQTHVVWGGPHVGIYPSESLGLEGVDSIVVGDGEVPFTALCERLANGESLEGVQGAYTGSASAHCGDFAGALNLDLNVLPLLDLTMLPYMKYRAYLTGKPMATFLTSRGCPFRCIFCKVDKNRIRLLSPERVVEQVKKYVDLGIKELEFYDETFNITVDRVKEFAARILEENIQIRWSFRGRIDRVDDEMLRMIKAAGCQRIQYGVEAGSDKVLQNLRKGTTTEDIRRCFKLTNKVGIDTVAYLILGSPGESSEDMEKTVSLVKEIRPTYVEYALFNISPGTEAYRMALEQEVIKKDIWKEYASNPVREMPVLLWTQDFSEPELESFRKKALRAFYVDPAYVARRLVKLKPTEFATTFRTGSALLRKLLLSQ